MATLKILNQETFSDFAKVVGICGQGCNYETKKGVEGFQVDFDIEVTNDNNATNEFHVVYQSLERSDSIMAYNGVEMSTARRYGCDSDESSEVVAFVDYDDNFLDELEEIAVSECKKWLDSQINSKE